MIDPDALQAARAERDARRKKPQAPRPDSIDSDFTPSDGEGEEAAGSAASDAEQATRKAKDMPKSADERANKAAQAYAKSYKPKAIVAPQYVISRVLGTLARFQVRRKNQVVQKIARYWSLKRASRRGAALLKRLHLEVREARFDGVGR